MTFIPICGYVAMYNIVYRIRGIGLYYYYNIRTIIIITTTTRDSKSGWGGGGIRLLVHNPTTTTTTTTVTPPSIKTTSNAITAYVVSHLVNREFVAAPSRLHTCARQACTWAVHAAVPLPTVYRVHGERSYPYDVVHGILYVTCRVYDFAL